MIAFIIGLFSTQHPEVFINTMVFNLFLLLYITVIDSVQGRKSQIASDHNILIKNKNKRQMHD